jgi:hypothetical protein
MPNREQRRAAGQEDRPRPHIEVEHDSNPYDIYLDQIGADKEAAFMQAFPGHTLVELLEGKVSSVVVAGWVWAARVPYEKSLTIGEVLKRTSLADLQTLKVHDGTEDDDPNPANDPRQGMTQAEVASDPGGTGG